MAMVRDLQHDPKFRRLGEQARRAVIQHRASEDQAFQRLSPRAQAGVVEQLMALPREGGLADVRQGLAAPSALSPTERLQHEQEEGQRSLAQILGMEGGGLKESSGLFSPLESVVSDVSTELSQRATGTPRTDPTTGQALAQIGLGTAGGLAGTALGGKAGGALGAAAGTFLGGLVTGRGPVDALFDAIGQGAVEYGSATVLALQAQTPENLR